MKHKKIALALTGILLASNANAEITFNGFANIVAGVTTSSDDRLYGYDDTIDLQTGSLFALQASSDLGNGLGVTAQILSRGENDWDPSFEWAYVSYDATDNLRFLAGRQRVPFYMYSDFLDVSYAYPWITPPEGVYSVAFDTFDGLGALYTTQLGDFDTTFHMIYGGNTEEIDVGGGPTDPDFKDLVGISMTMNRDWLTLRAGYLQTEMNIPVESLNPLVAGWTAAGFPEVADELLVEEDTGSFVELGFQVDYENILIIGEYTFLDLGGTSLADAESYYVMGGYRIDDWLVHLTYGVDEDTRDNFTAHVPGNVDPALDFLINTTTALIEDGEDESSYITVGARWNFHDSAALKFEFTNYSNDKNSNNDAGLFRTAIVTVF